MSWISEPGLHYRDLGNARVVWRHAGAWHCLANGQHRQFPTLRRGLRWCDDQPEQSSVEQFIAPYLRFMSRQGLVALADQLEIDVSTADTIGELRDVIAEAIG